MKRSDFIARYSKKEYIGDGLYVHFDGYYFILSTQRYEYRHPEWDTVGLEPPVFDALIAYRKRVYADAENIDEESEAD